MSMGCTSASGRSRRYVNVLSWSSLVYQYTNLKPISAHLARWVSVWDIDHLIRFLLKINMAVGKTDRSPVESTVEAAQEPE